MGSLTTHHHCFWLSHSQVKTGSPLEGIGPKEARKKKVLETADQFLPLAPVSFWSAWQSGSVLAGCPSRTGGPFFSHLSGASKIEKNHGGQVGKFTLKRVTLKTCEKNNTSGHREGKVEHMQNHHPVSTVVCTHRTSYMFIICLGAW